MKYLYLLLLLSSFTFGQTLVKDETNTYKYDTIVESASNKKALYSNALNWLSQNFEDSRYVTESKDFETGEIIFKGTKTDYLEELPLKLSFTAKIIVKDKKYRLIFQDLKYDYFIVETMKMNRYLLPVNQYNDDYDKTGLKDHAAKKYNDKGLSLLKNIADNIIASMNKKSDADF